MSFTTLTLEKKDGIVLLTLNRPEARNAITGVMIAELRGVIERIAADPEARVLVLTGAGAAFQSGADIRELSSMSQHEAFAWLEPVNKTLLALERLRIPVIAAVNGPAFGGGFELALACDMRIAAASARFALPETGLGIIPGAGGCERLSRIVGPGLAAELIMTGRTVDAEEALRLSLVNRIAPHGRAVEAAMELARTLCARPPQALAMAKKALARANARELDLLVFESARLSAQCFGSVEAQEGMAAFLEKRAPVFTKTDSGKDGEQ